MSWHMLARALHVFGAVGLFVAVGIEAAGLRSLFAAKTVGESRLALDAIGLNRLVGPVATLLTLATGIIVTRSWGWQPWVACSVGLFVFIVIVGAAVTGRRTAQLERELKQPDSKPGRVDVGVLRASLHARLVLLGAILALMVTRPELTGSVAVAGSATCAALAALFALSRRHADKPLQSS
jgi:hypothetical protein